MTTKVLNKLRNAFCGLASLAFVSGIANASTDTVKSITGYAPKIEASAVLIKTGNDSNIGAQIIPSLDIYYCGKHGEEIRGRIKDEFSKYSEDYKFNGIKIANYNGFTNKLSATAEYDLNDNIPVKAGLEIENNSANVDVEGLDSAITHNELFWGAILGGGYKYNHGLYHLSPYVEGVFKAYGNVKDSNNNTSNETRGSKTEYKLGINYSLDKDKGQMHADDITANLELGQSADEFDGTTSRSHIKFNISKYLSKHLKVLFGLKHTAVGNGASQDEASLGLEGRL